MHSMRRKIRALTISVLTIAVLAISIISARCILHDESQEAKNLCLLLCEIGEANLNSYFDNVQRTLDKISTFIEVDLEGAEGDFLPEHMERVKEHFVEVIHSGDGIFTFYYRIDPEFSETEPGFWYTNINGKGFVEREVTDITMYDTSDTTRLVWFTVPKNNGESVWLPPYITESLNARVISYNVPIYWKRTFIGVAGIEIDYATLAEQVRNIRLFNNGYAFLNDEQGNIFYHPRFDIDMEEKLILPEGFINENTFYHYNYDGVEKQAAWLPLSNGMRLTVTVPVSEANAEWNELLIQFIVICILTFIILVVFVIYQSGKITKPLEGLLESAQKLNQDDYDFHFEYQGNDEVGKLAEIFHRLSNQSHENLDPLTRVKHKGAFDALLQSLQNRIDMGEQVEYAIIIFDIDDLQNINSQYGKEEGDLCVKSAARLIRGIFNHSPLFRIGGDEFAVVLEGEAYKNRGNLVRRFDKVAKELSISAANPWEQVHVTKSIAVYDPVIDEDVVDTVRRTLKNLYAYKNKRTEDNKEEGE